MSDDKTVKEIFDDLINEFREMKTPIKLGSSFRDMAFLINEFKKPLTVQDVIDEIEIFRPDLIKQCSRRLGMPPSGECLNNTIRFLKLLPENIILPKFSGHCEEDSILYWRSEYFYLSIIFYNTPYISYHCNDDGVKFGRSKMLFEDNIPDELLINILKAK